MTGVSAALGSAPRVGAGRCPALLLIDFARGWTDPASPLSLPCSSEIAAAERLLRLARSQRLSVAFTTVAYKESDLETVLMLHKTPRVAQMRDGSPWTEVDSRIAPLPDELVIVKQHASAFFGTELLEYLRDRKVDTLVIGGCITSGCVRASVVDAAQHGFRALVVADAMADRSPSAHAASLLSIDELYGDVIDQNKAETVLGDCGSELYDL